MARTYVAVAGTESQVLGYYAVSNHQVSYEDLPEEEAKGLPNVEIPVVLLGRLAVERSAQGQGLGEHLLFDALRRVSQVSQQIGIRAVEVDAIDDRAQGST